MTLLIPAIDIRGGKAVRLRQGDYEQETVYAGEPLEAARRWVDEGAGMLHVVDLDGAREGRPVNLEHLGRIAALGVPVQYGGGLREARSVGDALQAGAARTVLGTRAVSDPEWLTGVLAEHGERVVVSVDARGGRVSLAGWTETGEEAAIAVIGRLREAGVTRFVYTSVDRDGMLSGPDPVEVGAVSEAAGEARLIYSGGIGSLDHLHALSELGLPNLDGVIAGKALYEGLIGLSDAQAAIGGKA